MKSVARSPVRVRPGVRILRTGPRTFLVTHPESGAQFECGAGERYLLHRLEGPGSLDDVLRDYAARFGQQLPKARLLEFVEQLRQLRLLGGPDQPPAGPVPVRPNPPPRPAPAPLSSADAGAALNRFFDLLALLFGWLLHPFWIAPMLVLALAAGRAAVHRWDRLFSDLHSPWDRLPGLPLAVGLLTQTVLLVNLPRALSVGMACRRFGGRVRSFGFTFWNGLVPTFSCELGDSLVLMSHRGRWTVLAVSMWVQVAIGSAALLAWAARPGSVFGIFWLWLVPPCALGFLINAVPFFDFCGYWVLCYAVEEFNLRERALAETNAWFSGRRAPEALTDRERYWFRWYGLGYYLFRLVFDPAVLLYCGFWMVEHFRGPGAIVFVALALWWYSDEIGRVLMESEAVQGLVRAAGYVLGAVGILSYAAGWFRWGLRGGGNWWVRWPLRLALLAAGLAAVAVTPYNYEIAGECRVLPAAQRGVRSQLEDEVVQVHVKEGAYVRAGDLVATLSGLQVRADLAAAEADLKHNEAMLELLLTGPVEEQVQIAASRVERATAELKQADVELERVRRLVTTRAASPEELDRRVTTRNAAREKLESAREGLAKLREGYRSERIRATEAEVKKLEEKVAHCKELLGQTEIRAPIAGHVVLPYLEERVGQHVKPGDLISVVQDTSAFLVEVAADDAAALDIQEGMKVKVRLYGLWGRLLTGRVQRLSLTSEPDVKFGNMPVRTDREMYEEQQQNSRSKAGGCHVRVYVALDEAPVNLSPDLTGYARIVVDEDDRLWRCLARPLVRFVRTEIWYWLP
jgi:HlyD family secretion protein